MDLKQLAIADRQVWLRAFYGFNPEQAGYIGFTKEGQRASMMDQMRDGDLVLIYGAVEELTDQDLRAQALGFLEVEVEACRDVDRMSEASLQWKVDHNFEDRWNYGLIVRRAWRVKNRVGIATIAPRAYQSRNRFTRTTTAMLLEADECERALSHSVYQVNVFGEPALPAQDLPQGQFEKLLRPSPGIPPSFGDRSSSYEDGENLLYLMMLTVGAEALLPKPAISFGHALAKVGRTNDASRRVKEVNCGFPENAFVRWKVERLHTYPNASEAHAAENDLKVLFADRFKSQGNEFFTGNRDQLVAAFDAYCAANAPRILGAPGKAKGI